MQPLRPVQSVDTNGSSSTSQQYVKPFSMDERALPASQRQILEQLVRQLATLTTQSTDDIWGMVREHLGLARSMQLSIQHYSMAEFFLQQRIQVAHQGGNNSILEQIMSRLNQGNNREMVLNYMRMTFGHSALSLLSEPELRQVLAQLPPQQNQQNPTSSNIPQTTPTNAPTPAPELSYSQQPILPPQQQIIQQLIEKLAQQLKQPYPLIQQQLSALLQHPVDKPLLNQHFTLARDFLQIRVITSSESLQPLNSLLNLLQPLTKQETQFIQNLAEQRFQALPVTILNSEQIDELIIELFMRRASGKSAWQVEGVVQPIFSNLVPQLQQLIDKPIFIPALFAIIMFLIFVIMI